MANPDPIHRVQLQDDYVDAQINRINELTRVGRSNWFGLMAYLAFAAVTVLGVDDADFFLDTRQTTLPLIGVSIPTLAFFIFAPILGTALYIYLHLHIRKMGEAIRAPDAFPKNEGVRLEHHLNSWLLVDLLLQMRADDAAEARPLDWGVRYLTFALVWWAGPVVLFLFWWYSWPAHYWTLTLFTAILGAACGWAGMTSWLSVCEALLDRAPNKQRVWKWRSVVLALAAACAFFGMVKTELGTVRPSIFFTLEDRDFMRSLHSFVTELEPADLQNLQTIDLSADQIDHATARREFRIAWCSRVNLPMSACGPDLDWIGQMPASVTDARVEWCETYPGDFLAPDCQTHFRNLESEFDQLWDQYRAAQFNTLAPANLGGRDMRNADLSAAQLQGADLGGAQVQGANLNGAQVQGANFFGAQLQGASLFEAQLQGANFFEAQLQSANLFRVQLQGANLREAQMQGANFVGAQMQGANLRDAQMQGADLNWAQMQGANLREAQMRGATLRDAQMQGANLLGAQMQGANLREAQMQGVDLYWAQLQGADLREAQMQGADLYGVQMTEDTALTGAVLRGAAVRAVDPATLAHLQAHGDWDQMFYSDDFSNFLTQWRAFAAALDPPVTIAPDYGQPPP
ncbi:hypothetical protein A8B78_21585 [Jannaschia sp. EhC01]|nr:hypothetical protein A8B78_21585 [Jannaschia sp. EhC01]